MESTALNLAVLEDELDEAREQLRVTTTQRDCAVDTYRETHARVLAARREQQVAA